jgi:hypothetical protein
MADETPKKGGKATITSDDNVKFLISCINYSSEGKVRVWTELNSPQH